MKYFLILCLGALLLSFVAPSAARATSEDDCAIWLCLPAGFTVGCGAAYKAFLYRISHRKPPLPNLSSCVSGPDHKKISGHYQLGYERYEPCQEGYVLREKKDYGRVFRARCVVAACASARHYRPESFYCQSYDAVRRVKTGYIKMWVNGDYLGQFFY